MAIVVRPADLRLDRDVLIAVLARLLTPLSDERRFDWLYQGGPDGPAQAWIATQEDSGRAVGVAAAFPRRLFVAGKETMGCVLGDFCIDPHYRSLGPALQLQRECMRIVETRVFALGYDFPSLSMLAVYKRLGVQPRDRIIRFAKPLRADRKIGESVKNRPIARGLAAVANQVMAWQDRGFRTKNRWRISRHEGPFGEEFSLLARRVSPQFGICVARLAEYLNWRYQANPLRRYEILTARESNALAGYVILTQSGENASIVDLFGFEQTEMFRSLLAEVVLLLRERGVITVSMPILASHRRVGWLADLGFRPRESSPVVLLAAGKRGTAPDCGPDDGWFLMEGDRDS